MITTFRHEKSQHGIDVDILISSVQKYIRRGEKEKAIWCVLELNLFSFTEAKHVVTNLFHRLMIIYLEDIGRANFNCWNQLDQILENFKLTRSENGTLKNPNEKQIRSLIEYVSILSESSKSRYFSHVKNLVLTNEKTHEFKKVQEKKFSQNKKFLLDLVQKSLLEDLKELQYGFLYHIFYSSYPRNLNAYKYLFQLYEEMKEKKISVKIGRKSKPIYFLFWLLRFTGENLFGRKVKRFELLCYLAEKWALEIENLKEQFLAFFMIVYLLLNPESIRDQEEVKIRFDALEKHKKHLSSECLKIDDYCIDMHTRQGKKTKDASDFALFGSRVSPEYFQNEFEKEMKLFYMRTKFQQVGKKMTEKDCFDFEVRVQLTCRASGQDTYFATRKEDGKRVFVKGPYPINTPPIQKRIFQLKKYFKGISGLPVKEVFLLPDMWLNVGLGYRNQCSPFELKKFLVFDDLCSQPYPRRIHSSKLWPPTEVVEWKDVQEIRVPSIEILETEVGMSFILNLLFRFLIGIPDVAYRNFIFHVEKMEIYGVDEEGINSEINFSKLGKKEKIHGFVMDRKDEILEIEKTWFREWKKKKNEILEILSVEDYEKIQNRFSSPLEDIF